MKKKFKIILMVCLSAAFIFLVGCFGMSDSDVKIGVIKAGEDEVSEETEAETESIRIQFEESSDSVESTSEEETVYVYICGAVEKSDVYQVPAGSRVNDVLIMAGGFSEGAAMQYVNLAQTVQDGERIYIPFEEEIDENMSAVYLQDGEKNVSDDKGAEDGGLININSAGKEELMTLPGIGEGKALEIIRYREENGDFKTVDELMNVSGIKEGTFRKLKDKITI
jgi:competence protein ComEA